MTIADCWRLAKSTRKPVILDGDRQCARVVYNAMGVVDHDWDELPFLGRVITRMKREQCA